MNKNIIKLNKIRNKLRNINLSSFSNNKTFEYFLTEGKEELINLFSKYDVIYFNDPENTYPLSEDIPEWGVTPNHLKLIKDENNYSGKVFMEFVTSYNSRTYNAFYLNEERMDSMHKHVESKYLKYELADDKFFNTYVKVRAGKLKVYEN